MTQADPITGEPVAIQFEGVHKAFGDFKVLQGVDLLIPRGRITVIIGRSGAGKSVILKHMMGLLAPDQGRIIVDGRDFSELSPPELRATRDDYGVVFQNAALFDSMDVFDNVAFPLYEHTSLARSEIEERVLDLLDQVGLEGSQHKMPSELSGGMRKRVGLARALVRDPDYLLYDEPTTGLDPILAAAMDQLIVDTQGARPGLTSVIISHDVAAVVRIADKIAFLVEGVIAREGDAQAFRESDDPLIHQFMTGSLDGPIEV